MPQEGTEPTIHRHRPNVLKRMQSTSHLTQMMPSARETKGFGATAPRIRRWHAYGPLPRRRALMMEHMNCYKPRSGGAFRQEEVRVRSGMVHRPRKPCECHGSAAPSSVPPNII